MTSILQLSVYAQTALASYAIGLQVAQSNVVRFVDPEVGMAMPQAETFDSTWAVLQQFISAPTIGFSAVLLQRKDASGNATGEKVLAIAGTNGWADLITDLVNVTAFGSVLNMPQYNALGAFYAELVSSGKLGASEQFTVTGHSLGGFLAQAFTARHPGVVSAAYTYNAPGFSGLEIMQGFLGVSDLSAAGKITNVHATDGVSMTAGLGIMLGTSLPVRIEASSNPLDNHSVVRLGDALAVQEAFARLQPGLSIERLGVLFAASSLGERRLEDAVDALRTVFINSSSNDANRTPTGDRESLHLNLNALLENGTYQSLIGHAQIMEGGVHFSSAVQADTYAALAYRYALLEMLPFAVVADTEAANQALYGAYTQRLSLYDEATGQGELTREWLADRAMLLEAIGARNVNNGSSQIAYSNKLPVDRSYELRWFDGQGAEQILIAENTARQGGVLAPVPSQLLQFGSDGADTLNGSSNQLGDHLYGGNGNDVLNGLAGADRLEGNSGDDILDGGAGNDTLLGGRDHDTYRFTAGWGVDAIVDADGSGAVQVDVEGLGELKGTASGARRVAEGVWQTADRRVNYTLVAASDSRNDLYISFADRPDVIRIQAWTPGALGIALDPAIEQPALPPVDRTLVLDDPYGPSGQTVDLRGSAFSYHVLGTPDSDIVSGSTSGDRIEGGGSGDRLYGDDGDDHLWGDAALTLDAAIAAAQLAQVATQSDVLEGGRGDDVLIGSAANYLFGGAGRDILVGGGDVDWIQGDTFAGGGWAPNSQVQQHFHYDEARGKYTYYVSETIDGSTRYYARLGPLDDDGEGDTVIAGAGDDTVDGELGDDILDLGAGGDVGIGWQGADILRGGTGDDALFGDFNADAGTPTGNEPAELLLNYAGLAATLHGNDWLDGGTGDDLLWGNGGADWLYGGDGADRLHGDDFVTPEPYHGNDVLYGDAGDDELHGDGGDDELYGGSGSDSLLGGEGNDRLDGGGGADAMAGGAGDDEYRVRLGETASGAYRDTIYDTQGNDRLVIEGVALADLTVQHRTDGTLSLGWAGSDGVLVDQGLTSSLGTAVLGGQALALQRLVGDRLGTSIVAASARDGGNLWGGAMADTLDVAHADNRVAGGRGNDSIELASSSGTVVVMAAGDGTDTVSAVRRDAGDPEGRNVLELAHDIDAAALKLCRVGATAYVLALNDAGDGVQFSAGDGSGAPVAPEEWPFDVVRLADGSELAWQQIVDRGIATLPQATAGDDAVVLTPIGDTFYGLDGNDTVDGLAGNDTIYGDAGDDTLIGGAGNDALFGGTGSNILLGGDGDDALVGGSASSRDVSDGGEGNDTYRFVLGYGIDVSGLASDSSPASDDTYAVFGQSMIGGYLNQTWTIHDAGGNDRLVLQSSNIRPTNTTLRHVEGGLALRSWNLTVRIEGGVRDDGTVDPARGIESIAFQDGTVWTADQVRALTLQTTTGDDTVLGYSGDDTIDGLAGNDVIDGGDGRDTLRGGAGGDTLRGGRGDDWLDAGTDGGMLVGGAGDDTYVANAGDGSIQVGAGPRGHADDAGSDTLEVGALRSAVGVTLESHPWIADEDQLVIRWNDGSATARMLFDAGGGSLRGAIETVRFADGTTLDVAALVAAATTAATAGNDTVQLKSSDDIYAAGDGNDTVHGRGGDDRLDGGNGSDNLYGGIGDDVLRGSAGSDALYGGAGANTIEFGVGAGQDVAAALADGSNALLLDGSVAAGSVLVSWADASFTSTYREDGSVQGATKWLAGLRITLPDGVDSVRAGVSNVVDFMSYDTSRFGVHEVRFADGSAWTLQALLARANQATTGNDVLFDAGSAGLLTGGDGNDTLYGLDGSNRLFGEGGNDTLRGGDADDLLVGGVGDDVILGAAGINTLRYALGDGNDTVWAGYQGSTVVEFAPGIAAGDVTLVRDSLASFALHIGGGSIRLNSVRERRLLPTEVRFPDGTVWASAELAERLFSGTAGDDHIVGFADTDDTIAGGDGNDVLEGGTGSDTLDGGAGDDVLYAKHSGAAPGGCNDADTLIGGAGDDRLYAGNGTVTYRFSAGFGVDRIEATSERDPAKLARLVFDAGVAPSQVSVSRSATGLVLSVPATGDAVHIANFFAGMDTTALHASRPLDRVEFDDATMWDAAALVARLVPALTATDDLFLGTAGDDVVDALGGNDHVRAGTGNDIVRGGAGDDTLHGEDGDDVLDGGEGSNRLEGGAGNDRYTLGSAPGANHVRDSSGTSDVLGFEPGVAPGDVTVALGPPEGTDLVYRFDLFGGVQTVFVSGIETVQFSDGTRWSVADVDQLARTIIGTSGGDVLNGTAQGDRLLGLAGNDQLNGYEGADHLDGGAGADTMRGGSGDDTYVVDSSSDTITESSGQGSDTVSSSLTWTLGANLENLVLTGTDAINATGNTLANVLTGNAANNALNGGAGADTLIGGAGNDAYTVDNAGDVVTELAGEGTDTVSSSVTYTLAAQVENLTLTGNSAIHATGNALDNVLSGNSGNNTLTGGAGNDTLNGGAGTDTMRGGTGDDTYVVNVSTDVVTELANEGIDTVQSSVTLTLGNHVENLTLTGSSAINGTGNTLDNLLTGNSANNTLTGNAGNDTLDGGAGTDTMRGGAGNDIYVVERSADVVTENANAGTDTVRSSVTWTLGSNLENLTLTGMSAINGTGNALNNTLTGNAAANTLAGAAGNDSYAGGGGNDTLNDTSTTSNDVYAWGRGEGADALTDAGGTDRLDILAGATEDQIWLRRVGSHLEVSLIGTGDRFTVNNWYASSANRVESFRLADGQALQASQVQQLVDAMAAFAPPAAGETTLPPDYQSALQPVIAANWV
jgi:Ca2+-binding RTX toxin-like protein